MMIMDLQPILQTDRVLLRPLHEEDWEPLFAVAADPEIWAMHPAPDRYLEPVFRAFFEEAMACKGAFAIIDKQSGAIIGSTRYAGYDADRSEIEIGWTFYARSHWRTGHNREVKYLMLSHIFHHVETVVFRIGADNLRSRTAVERLGGRFIGGHMHEYNGKQIPYVSYYLTAADASKGALALKLEQ